VTGAAVRAATIKDVALDADFLRLTWDDGTVSRYH
jgi:hypothetical protein